MITLTSQVRGGETEEKKKLQNPSWGRQQRAPEAGFFFPLAPTSTAAKVAKKPLGCGLPLLGRGRALS